MMIDDCSDDEFGMLSLYPEILIVHDFILGGMDWRVRVISVDCSCLCLFLAAIPILGFVITLCPFMVCCCWVDARTMHALESLL
ncbi:hypothetical protein F2Q68_00046223 [Brassica cretica]|uniref:Uncharacterized protein n=1 Tax=Brassica cretica TaxID=69181 RepID=A0A8S9LHA9_BRACR|nr:hypothetical protein F2Q68_00046223 [Brassica cretica]